jgi:phage terminase large subunit-like protein
MHVGQPVVLRPWQRQIICGIYDRKRGQPATRRAIISFGRKNGKGLALDTPIPTPGGWRTMGSLREGDQVFAEDGTPCSVRFVSPVHVGLKCWRVTFSDGTSVVADEQHQWLTTHRFRPWAGSRVNGSGNGGRRRVGIVTTPQIAESVCVARSDGGTEYNHRIDVAAAVQTADVDLPLDPYLLGYWLGDGSTDAARITAGDEDVAHVVDEVRKVINSDPVTRRDRTAWTVGLTSGRGGNRDVKVQSVLRRIGVLGNKHVPAQYAFAGTEQRRALLQGLMDSDGSVAKAGRSGAMRCEYVTTSQTLADDVAMLARSLGLKATTINDAATIDGRVVGTKRRVTFTAWQEDAVFRLARKSARLLPRPDGRRRSDSLHIVSCEPVESVPTRCIQVDSPSSLFLAGHGFTATHNTALVAMLVLLHLVGPEAKANSQLFSAAQSRDQASLVFGYCAKMIRLDAALSSAVTIRDTAKQLLVREIGTTYRALSADASTAYGLSPIFVVHDELGQVRGPRSELYEALETATGAQAEPLSIVISTQAPTDADLLSLLIDDAKTGADPQTRLHLFTAGEDLDPFGEAAWKAANPAYGDFLNPAEVRQTAETARRMPSAEAGYRNLILNQRVNASNPFVSRAMWDGCAGDPSPEAFEANPVYAGLDLSARQDLTALVLAAKDADGYWHVRSHFWAPQVGLADRARRDRVPYDLWAQQGHLETTPGASVDYAYVAQRLGEIARECDLRCIAYDRWRIDVLKAELEKAGIDVPLAEFGQGFKDMSPALDVLEAELASGRLLHGGTPILTWNAANAVATRDPAGNRKLDKSKATGRIDGLVALAMALGVASSRMIEVVPEETILVL